MIFLSQYYEMCYFSRCVCIDLFYVTKSVQNLGGNYHLLTGKTDLPPARNGSQSSDASYMELSSHRYGTFRRLSRQYDMIS